MPAPVIVPRDKSLDQVLATDQVHMLIIGSSQRATELAELAGEVSDRDEFGGAVPRCAVQVTDDDAVTPRCVRKSGKRPIPPSSRSSATAPSSAPSSTTARSTASTSKTCSSRPAYEIAIHRSRATRRHFRRRPDSPSGRSVQVEQRAADRLPAKDDAGD